VDAETVLRILREPAIKVAEGVAEAASIHIRSLVARLGIVNRELREAERKLDELCIAVSEIEQTSGESLQRRDVAILRHESARTTKLYDRRNDQVTLDQVERIVL
jgi:hypothetical protein